MKKTNELEEDTRQPGKKMKAELTRNTDTARSDLHKVYEDSFSRKVEATPDERNRNYNAAFDTVYDASNRVNPKVPTIFPSSDKLTGEGETVGGHPNESQGFRIQPKKMVSNVDQYNQNVLPGVMEDDVAEGSVKEHQKSDADYPGGHLKGQVDKTGFDPDKQSSSRRAKTVDSHDYFMS
jgi:hypothetical protein